MPIFKKQDMWMPNTFYYATERYKSVIEYNNQLYVCTDSISIPLSVTYARIWSS